MVFFYIIEQVQALLASQKTFYVANIFPICNFFESMNRHLTELNYFNLLKHYKSQFIDF